MNSVGYFYASECRVVTDAAYHKLACMGFQNEKRERLSSENLTPTPVLPRAIAQQPVYEQ
jgi:hypothetical protein